MRADGWHLVTRARDDDENEMTKSQSPEDLVDHFGINLSLLILCIALLIAGIWMISGPSFERCSALRDVTQRNACYGELRNELMKPPAKGGEMPRG
jgi:hypothetical protein